MNLKTAIASLLVGTAAWSSGVEGFNVPSGSAVGSVRTVETTTGSSNSGNSYSNLLAQIDDANPYAQNLKSKLSMVAGGAQAEEYYEGKFGGDVVCTGWWGAGVVNGAIDISSRARGQDDVSGLSQQRRMRRRPQIVSDSNGRAHMAISVGNSRTDSYSKGHPSGWRPRELDDPRRRTEGGSVPRSFHVERYAIEFSTSRSVLD